MYKARFYWLQDKRFPIYKDLLDPILNSQSNGMGVVGDDSGTSVAINLDLDITEDFTYEIKSNYQNYGDALSGLPFVGTLLGYMETANNLSGVGGKSTDSSEWLKFQVWKETEPFKMTFKFVLSTYTDPFIDVYAPAMALSSMSILSPVENSGGGINFYTPGVNSSAIGGLSRNPSKTSKTPDSKSTDTFDTSGNKNTTLDQLITSSSKIIQEFILWSPKVDGGTAYKKEGSKANVPGVPLLKIKNCFIETAKPTWSKDRTASGIPIWCELELGIQSIFSANDSMFSYLTKTPNYTGGLDATKKIATNIFR
jgi:hypothetical protein